MNYIPLGLRHTYGGFTTPYQLPVESLLRHVHVLGKTGTGKSTLLQSLLKGLVDGGGGFAVLDPHGDLAQWVLEQIPRDRVEDVVHLDFGDAVHVPALNLVSQVIPRESRPRVASALVAAFRHIWQESWGPRLEHILYHSLRLLLDAQNVSLVSLPRLLVDDTFRASLLRQCDDPFICSFFETEFDAWDKRFRAEAIASIQNKLGQLVAMPAIRHSLGQVRLRVDVREIMDRGRILVVDLSKGKLGDDASRLLGALLTSMLGAVAMERGALPAEARKPFVLVMDEAQNFLSDAMASILSESRKFGLGLVFCHQYLDQLTPAVRAAALGNAGTTVAFATSGEDAEVLAMNSSMFSARQFAELPPFTALMRCSLQSVGEFRLSLSPPVEERHDYRDSIISRCRDHLCSRRAEVEARLNRWLAEKHDDPLPRRRRF